MTSFETSLAEWSAQMRAHITATQLPVARALLAIHGRPAHPASSQGQNRADAPTSSAVSGGAS
jgi:hypothetical protein